MKHQSRSLVRNFFLAMVLLSLGSLALITWQGFRATGEALRGQAALHQLEGAATTAAPAAAAAGELRRIQLHLLADAGLALLAALLLAAWLSLRLRRELESLGRGADRIAAGDLDHRLPTPRRHRELEALADSINRLAQALSRQIRTLDGQRAELDALLAGLRDGVLALDRGGRVHACNPAAARLLGLGSHPLGALLAELSADAGLLAALEDAWERQEQVVALAPATPAAPALRLWTQPLPAAPGRDMPLLLAVVSDVSTANRVERLRQEFVANVSHELKTPVTSIRGYVETLAEGDADPETAARFLEVIGRQARRLDAIIDDLLALSRLERQDETPLARGAVDLPPLLSGLLEDFAPQARAARVRLELELEPGAPHSVPASAPLLERALANLLSNAIRYGGPDSRVVLRLAAVTRAGRPGLRLEVADEGPGIAPEHLPRIFERFYVVDKARSRALGGTGLGLALVKHAAAALGGEAGVTSQVGLGSLFWIWLPAAADAPASGEKPQMNTDEH